MPAALPDLLATTNTSETVTEVTLPVTTNEIVQETKYFIVTSDPATVTATSETVAQPPVKKARKILPKLIMPKQEQVEEKPKPILGLDTPAIDAVMAKNATESNFDLLAFVTNETLDPTDPSFLNLVGDTTPTASNDLMEIGSGLETLDAEELSQPGPSKGKRRLAAKEKKGKAR